jgi:chemotaxis protein CheD
MLRQYSPRFKRPLINIQPGEYYVTSRDEVIATILGSCVSVCIRDVKRGIGGMNHFMLPGGGILPQEAASPSARYGVYAMELVIGGIIKRGGGRDCLEAKVFGGGHVLPRAPACGKSVPQANLEFVREFLALEDIPLASHDVGGHCGRKVLYLPRSGKVLVKRLNAPLAREVLVRERSHGREALLAAETKNLTIFKENKLGPRGEKIFDD